jgi:hypothetical protein
LSSRALGLLGRCSTINPCFQPYSLFLSQGLAMYPEIHDLPASASWFSCLNLTPECWDYSHVPPHPAQEYV